MLSCCYNDQRDRSEVRSADQLLPVSPSTITMMAVMMIYYCCLCVLLAAAARLLYHSAVTNSKSPIKTHPSAAGHRSTGLMRIFSSGDVREAYWSE
ncbi:hypothetical protein Ddc_05705 [Ditylenchus destructor]|nr:hypothetical protein Ddc_05705 [Ditylenchus destructor]